MVVKRAVALGLLWATVSGIMYGAITVGAKAVDAPPLAKGALSAFFAALVLAYAWRGLRIARKDWPRVATMALLGGALAPAFILYGLDHVSAMHAGLLLTVELVATGVLAMVFLRERTTLRSSFGLVALLGAGVAIAFAARGDNGSSLLGIGLVALAALAWSVDNIVSARLTGTYTSSQLIAAKTTLAFPLLAVAWALVDPRGPATLWDWLLQAGIGMFGVGLSSVAFYQALRSIGAARTIAINVPVAGLTAALGGWILLDEPAGWLEAVAGGLVAAGIVLLWERSPSTGKAGRSRPDGASPSKGS